MGRGKAGCSWGGVGAAARRSGCDKTSNGRASKGSAWGVNQASAGRQCCLFR